VNALLVARRDLASYLHGYTGYVIVAAALFMTGVLFQAFGMSGGARYSHEVLQDFFQYAGFVTNTVAVLITMRSLAEERQLGTDVLLQTSPISDVEVVVGKFLAAVAFLAILLALTVYMPALIFVNGKVSPAHIATGYLGLLVMGAATASIGIAASSLFRSQLPAGLVAGVIVGTLIAGWTLSNRVDAPFSEVMSYVAFWDKHFHQTFEQGRLHVRDIVYFLSVSFVFLLGATKVLEGRRLQ
jgi:ABC-2 type transport system permease protein